MTEALNADYNPDTFTLTLTFTFKLIISGQDVGYFWHITDMHWDPSYVSGDGEDGALSCNEGKGEAGDWGKWGDFLCDSPWSLINSSVYAMKNIHPDPDFLIWTG